MLNSSRLSVSNRSVPESWMHWAVVLVVACLLAAIVPPAWSQTAPTLNAPSNDLLIDMSGGVTVTWTGDSAMDSYRVEVVHEVAGTCDFSGTLAWSGTVFAGNLLSLTIPESQILETTPHCWRVVGVALGEGTSISDPSGGTYQYPSNVRTFLPLRPPSTPVLYSPQDGEADTDTYPRFNWEGESNVYTYTLEIATDASMQSLHYAETLQGNLEQAPPSTTSILDYPDRLQRETRYYWRVTAENPLGVAISPINEFATVLPAPSAPAMVAPEDGSLHTRRGPTLQWEPEENAYEYRIEVAPSDPTSATPKPAIPDSLIPTWTVGRTQTSFSVPQLDVEKEYVWRITALHPDYQVPAESWFLFRTRSAQPQSPQPVHPLQSGAVAGESTSSWPELRWQTAPGATRYRIQVAEISDVASISAGAFTNPVVDETIDAASQTPGSTQRFIPDSLIANQPYAWRVKGAATDAWGPWSTTEAFRTALPPDGRRYYITDHLGSTRSVVDPAQTDGDKVVEVRDYYPFGLHLPVRGRQEGEAAAEDYTGYELDDETSLRHAGARYYMAVLARFSVTDRFTDKYPSLSPYQYAANNPASLIDVNGDSIWVADGDERFLYTGGADYEGDSEFIAKAVSTLNTIRSTEAGSEVLSSLVESESNYNLVNQKPPSEKLPESVKAMQFKENENGGVNIFAGSLTGLSERLSIESTAHELFHGYQREIGQDPATTFSEVGAYLFGPSTRAKIIGGIVSFAGTDSRSGSEYTTAMTELYYGDNFSRQAYQRGSLVGNLYPNHPTGPLPMKPAISTFYPLNPGL